MSDVYHRNVEGFSVHFTSIVLDLPQIATASVGHSYIEGDVRQLLEVKDLSLFQKFVRLCAGRSVYFWRDSGGLEIDLVVEESGSLLPIEIKAGMTLTPDFFTSLQKWMSLAGNRVVHPTLAYGGTENVTFKGIRVLG